MDQPITPFDKLLGLTGKTAIVTGGAMGIGLGIVTRLAQAGANVLIADLDEAAGQKSAGDLSTQGLKVKAIKTDVADEASVQDMVQTAVKEFGGLDIMVNNAGIYPQMPLSKMTKEDFDRVIAVNLRGVFLCTEAASKQMISQGRGGSPRWRSGAAGKIINITSIDALHPSMVGLAHYDASKHGVWGFTQNAALELAQHKIWVNAIAPGGIATPGVAKMSQPQEGTDMEKVMEQFLAKIPMHRMGEPDDIGKVALFLASDMSSYMTGEQIVVDGGVLLS
jgi:2-deoxy-D-gluconate 3-dehydrogenase